MIGRLSKKITTALIGNDNIAENERELYEYGLFLFLTMILFTIVDIIAGLLFGILTESLLFMLSFLIIRQFAGGYHAKTEAKCELFSSISIIVSIALMKLFVFCGSERVLYTLSIIAAVFIMIFSPVDSEEKILTAKERKVFKRITIIISVVFLIIGLFSLYFGFYKLIVPISMGICLEATLLMLAVITNKTKQRKQF